MPGPVWARRHGRRGQALARRLEPLLGAVRRGLVYMVLAGLILGLAPAGLEGGYRPLAQALPGFIADRLVPDTIVYGGHVYHVRIAQYQPFAGFSVAIKTGLLLGVFGGLPLMLYEVLRRLSPGASRARLARGLLVAGVLFWLGFLLGLLVVVPSLLRLGALALVALAGGRLAAFSDVESLVGAALLVSAGVGLALELPVMVYYGVSLGVLRREWFQGERARYVAALSMLLGMIISPDPSGIGMLIIGGLLFLGIVLAARLAPEGAKSYKPPGARIG